MNRPICEWKKYGDEACKAKATHLVGFVHNDRFVRSCEAHAEHWQYRGHGWWVAKLQGFCGDCDNMIGDILRDNQRIGKARREGELQAEDEYNKRKADAQRQWYLKKKQKEEEQEKEDDELHDLPDVK